MRLISIRDKAIISGPMGSVIQNDFASETYRFLIPKTFADETDLSAYTFYLQYRNEAGEGESVLLSKEVSGDVIHLDWKPQGAATQQNGDLDIQIYGLYVVGTVTYRWTSKPATIHLDEDLNPTPIVANDPAVFQQYLTQFQALTTSASNSKDAAAQSATAAKASEDAAKASQNAANQSKIDAQSAADEAEDQNTSAHTAMSAAQTAQGKAETAKSGADTAKSDAEAARDAAKEYRDEAMAISGVGNHVTDPMPHQNVDENGANPYKYGFRITTSGTVQFCYEEVV